MKTVAIYRNDGLRIGTFTPRKHYSIRSVSEQFCYRYPNMNPDTLLISQRIRLMGRASDSAERIPFDCGYYKINWDNGASACGTFPAVFRCERTAEDYARNWARKMKATDRTVGYTWEVVEVG